MVTYNAFNSRIALLFLRTHVALGVKKAPTGLSRTANVFVFNGIPGEGEFKESDCDNGWQPEIVIWPPKPEVLISLEL